MKVISPASQTDFEKYYNLRYEVLRAPWQQPRGTELAADDPTAFHALLLDDTGEAAGVCRLHLETPEEGQLGKICREKGWEGCSWNSWKQKPGNWVVSSLPCKPAKKRFRFMSATGMN